MNGKFLQILIVFGIGLLLGGELPQNIFSHYIHKTLHDYLVHAHIVEWFDRYRYAVFSFFSVLLLMLGNRFLEAALGRTTHAI